MQFYVEFMETTQRIDVGFNKTNGELLTDFSNLFIIKDSSDVPLYDGEYIITPKINAQQFETVGKRMADNLTVQSIPYYEVSNQQNGTTVIIGG